MPSAETSAVPQLLALDWGTSSLRAFLMAGGTILDARDSRHGSQSLPQPGVAGFEAAFRLIAGDWLQRWPRLPIVAGGMVGSAHGWREAPYVRCPVDARALAHQGVTVPSGLGPEILIAPGVLFDVPPQLPDVMRGEEIQIAGAVRQNPHWAERCCIVLPGTHSKWTRIEQGRIIAFATYLTGELYAVLKEHSILGRLLPPPETDAKVAANGPAFELGLNTARDSGPGDFPHQIFATRTLGLTGRLPPDALADFLSGVLIGHELVSGLKRVPRGAPLLLVGGRALCQRYRRAFEMLGQPGAILLDNTAPAGLWDFARAAGLLAEGNTDRH